MKNADYWRMRFSELENEQYRKSETFIKDLERQFQVASNSIQAEIEKWFYRLAENNDISYSAAKKLLKANELEEFHWNVETYIKYGKQNAVNPKWMKELENASARIHIKRLEALKIQIQQEAEKLYQEYHNGVTDFLKKSYADRYYHTAYEIDKGCGIGHNFVRLDINRIEEYIKKPWTQDGKNFSDRIWENKDRMLKNLHTELTQCIIRGQHPDEAAAAMSKRLGVGMTQARRLVYTESAAVASSAAKKCFEGLDVEKYEIVATLDSHTSEICRSMDGKVFDMGDYETGVTAPPFHVNCRTVTCPCFKDEFTDGDKRAARGEDGRTYYVPADMKYGEWKKKYVDNDGKAVILNEEESMEEVLGVHFIGKLDKNIYKCVTEDIVTDEVIITDNQIEHIRERHPKDYNEVVEYISTALKNPDYILEDKHKNTGLVIKSMEDRKDNIQMVLRIHTSVDKKGFKNSIISCWKISNKRLQNYLRNKKILYKQE